MVDSLNIVREYDELGIHRTGSAVDIQTVNWIVKYLAESGYEVDIQKYQFQRFVDRSASISFGSQNVLVMPAYDSPLEGFEKLTGTLYKGREHIGDIQVLSVNSMSTEAFQRQREASSARAILAVTLGSEKGLTPPNADLNKEVGGPPVFYVSSEFRDLISEAIKYRHSVTINLDGCVKSLSAKNIIAERKGTDSNLDDIVIFTPTTGWWHCASERGCGVALLISLAHSLSHFEPKRTVKVLFTSGHELGHLGMRNFVGTENLKVNTLWLHLGASFAAAKSPLFFMQASSQTLESLLIAALRDSEISPDIVAPSSGLRSGEAELVPKDADIVSLQGGNGLFHHKNDRFPQAVASQAFLKIEAAVLKFLKCISMNEVSQ